MGLKLESARASVEVLVVDSAGKPGENQCGSPGRLFVPQGGHRIDAGGSPCRKVRGEQCSR